MTKETNGSGATCRYHSGHAEKLTDHERRLARLESAVERIMSRPPVWVTLVFALFGALLGAAGTMLIGA